MRAHTAAKACGVRFLPGARLDFADSTPSLVCYPKDREAFGRLTRLLSTGKLRAQKGGCELGQDDLLERAQGQVLLAVPPAEPDEAFEAELARLVSDLPERPYLIASRAYGARDVRRLDRLAEIAGRLRTPLVATNDVLFHTPERRPLQDVLTCVREKCTIHEAGFRLEANAERHLKPPEEMARLFRRWPDALARTLEVVERCGFSLDHLQYEYPHEPVPPGWTAMGWLTHLAREGAKWRYPNGAPAEIAATLEKELALIAELDYPHYFLTVHDLVKWARDQGILCQGRGSAANSAVCYCLGVTAVNPVEHGLLFERFLSKERSEPPDIDVDFEHERREEVIQYVYRRYGRERAAICATVIHYRPRMAVREVGKALGLTEDLTSVLADTVWGGGGGDLPDAHVRQAGLDPDNPEIRRAVALTNALIGFPRHLSQHVGGFVLTERRLDETVPIGNAAMKDRTFIEWDKDDIDDLGLMKVDVLALGMLSCLKRGFDLMAEKGVTLHGRPITDIDDVPGEDPAVYAMLSKADSVGVFQVESRAQMSMLPRLKPKTFYDLVIEVAIVRPGPIQGDMVHPYLRRRDGIDPVEFPSPAPEHGPADELESVLGRTLRRAPVPGAGDEARHARRRSSRPTRPISCDAPWPPSRTWATSPSIAPSSSRAWPRAAMRATSPNAASSRSRASAPTASRRAMRRASPSWSTPPPGSRSTIRTSSAPPSSTASRWASTSPPSSSATPARTASRCARPTCGSATGTVSWRRSGVLLPRSFAAGEGDHRRWWGGPPEPIRDHF